ncbi:MAG TPA: zf-HC2 domain-containing protein [Candidatus Angelobacter sp.]|nr:zf-HC2 domain-containing protein [Candidatus Angelobacter sp.]
MSVDRCEKALLLMSQSIDRKLSLRERLMLRCHLFLCRRCKHRHESGDVVDNLLRIHRRQTEPPLGGPATGLSEEARARIKRALREKMKRQTDMDRRDSADNDLDQK